MRNYNFVWFISVLLYRQSMHELSTNNTQKYSIQHSG